MIHHHSNHSSSFFLKSLGEKRFVYPVKLLPLNIKSINAIQKYPHIIESYACILRIFVLIFLFLINVSISLGICSTPKLSKYVTTLFFTCKTIQCQYQNTHLDLLHMPHSLFYLANYL